MAKKLTKKAAVAAAQKKPKSLATRKAPSSALKSATPKAAAAKKPALSKPASPVKAATASTSKHGRITLSKSKEASAKPVLNGSDAAHAKKSPINGTKAVNGKAVAGKAADGKDHALGRGDQAVNTKAGKSADANTKPGKIEAPKPTGRPMLLQGPVAIRPMGKKATLPPAPPKPLEKPVRKKLVPTGEPAFVVVQPPTKAVATSEKAAKNRAGLNQKDLDFFRDLLLAKRRELLGDMNSMEREALRENSTDLSNLPVHMADQGTDAYEQEFTLHLVEKDRTLLRELNDALAKIQNGTYGICEGTGLPISKPRLEAQPWARYSIEHARVLEKRQMMFRR